METLTNLLSKDFVDFSVTGDDVTCIFRTHVEATGSDESRGKEVSVADVVLYGLNFIVPLMSAELLKASGDRGFPMMNHYSLHI